MISRVLLLEDDPAAAADIQKILSAVAGRELKFVHLRNQAEAKGALANYSPGELFPLIIDLEVPSSSTESLDRHHDWTRGLDVLEEAWTLGHREGLIVVSTYADEHAESKRILEAKGIKIEKWLSRERDLEGLAAWRAHFAEYFEDVARLVQELRSHGIFVGDRALRATLTELLGFARRAIAYTGDRLPAILLVGSLGEGKSYLGKVLLPRLKRYALSGTTNVDKLARSVIVNLPGTTSVGWGDSEKVVLFGAKNYSSRGGSSSSDGVFIEATAYEGSIKRPIVSHLAEKVKANRARSGVLVLDEILSCSQVVHDALLAVLTEGFVEPVGAEHVRYPVAPIVVGTTNMPLHGISDRRATGAGEVSSGFLSRFEVVRVPKLAEWAYESVLDFLELLGRPVAPVAKPLLHELHLQRLLTARNLEYLARSVEGAPRVDEKMLYSLFAPPGAPAKSSGSVKGQEKLSGLPITATELAQAERAWQDIVRTGGKAIRSDILLAQSDLDVSPSVALGVLIVAMAEVVRGERTRSEIAKWFGVVDENRNGMRNKVVALRKRMNSRWGRFGMKEVKRWAALYNERRSH